MWGGFDLLFTNLGMSLEAVILIVGFLGGLPFIAKDFRLGSVYYLVIGGGMFMWFYSLNQSGQSVNWSYALVFMFLALAFMALNLFNVRRNEGVVV